MGDFVFNEHIDPVAVRACLSALLVAFRHSTESLAICYANIILARRDAVLRPSSLPTEVRSALRGVPLSTSSLLSPALRVNIKTQADVQRDTALAFLPTLLSQ